MQNSVNVGGQKLSTKTENSSNSKQVVGSTFVKVRPNKAFTVQNLLEHELPEVIGSFFSAIAVESVDRPDYDDPDKIHHDAIYTVMPIQRKVKAPAGTLLTVKVKDAAPILSMSELEKVQFGEIKPVVLRFDDLAHYSFSTGETLNASKAEKLLISPSEVANK